MTALLRRTVRAAIALTLPFPVNATAAPPSAGLQAPAAVSISATVGGISGIDLSTPARRFGLGADWLAAVVHAESGGNPLARSPRGAVGLMQLMPGAYADMRRRLGLGIDPWRAEDNLAAGAGYLRLLTDRYGATGGLAAYNAGPARYERWLNGAATLPAETRAYVARVRATVGGPVAHLEREHGPLMRSTPLAAPLFVTLAGMSGALSAAIDERQPSTSAAPHTQPVGESVSAPRPTHDPLFAVTHPPGTQP